MNAPERISLPDVQSQRNPRGLPIDAVGINHVRYPITVTSGTDRIATIASFAMSVELPAIAKGTHMSRFIEILEDQEGSLDAAAFQRLVLRMLERLQARRGTVEMRFPWFARKAAPVSGAESLLDYDVTWRGTAETGGQYALTVTVVVPATSLCPCSKDISAYGAHNQRTNIQIEAELAGDLDISDLILVAERSASCEVYGLLKRADEKYVTERAYDNPRFVEDLVREVASELRTDVRVRRFVVQAENFESIHNHSAIATLRWPPRELTD